jgi:hypothetical protein
MPARTVHAMDGDGTVCGRQEDGEPVSSHWPEVTCGDCHLAARTCPECGNELGQPAVVDGDRRLCDTCNLTIAIVLGQR